MAIAGLAFGAAVLFVVTLVVFVNMRGGVGSPDSMLARLPLLGGLVTVKAASEEGTAAPSTAQAPVLSSGREATFLRFGSESELVRLAGELRTKKAEYDEAKRELDRRARELAAWEQQLKEERDMLRDQFARQKDELDAARADLEAREAQVSGQQVAIEAEEEKNLKKTAEIYGKMEAERAAEMLASLYSSGDEETVVKIIYLMQDRSAAKVLGAFVDPTTGATITEKLKHVGREVQQGG
jgi:flagellar motility protein MotE (MotC chaperone)